MPDEGFLRRWSRLKAEAPAAAPPAAAEPPPGPPAAPSIEQPAPRAPQTAGATPAPVLPTLDDVARLDGDSDFSAFVTRGVDKDVQRLAMKKLFADPHFNLVDRLDVYMDDYNKPSPMSAAMLAALHHTKNLFAPLAADKAAERNAQAAAGAGEGAAAIGSEASPDDELPVAANTDGELVVAAGTDADPAGAGITDSDPARVRIMAAVAPAQLAPIPFHDAAAGGVPQQTQQGKA